MQHHLLFSRRSNAPVDFRPNDDDVETGPGAELRRLSTYLGTRIAPPDALTGCEKALSALREYTYRKIFSGTTHEQFVETDSTVEGAEAIDWLIAVHEVESEHFRSQRAATEQRRGTR